MANKPLAITGSRTHARKLPEASRLNQQAVYAPLGCTGMEAQGQIAPTLVPADCPWSFAPKAPLEVIGWVTTANSPLLSPPWLGSASAPSRKRAV